MPDYNEPLSDRELEAYAKLRGSIFSMLLPGAHPNAASQITHAFDDGIEISTINSSDLGWETAILLPNGGTHPVERYNSKEEAEAGHQRWIERIPGMDEIQDVGYPELEAYSAQTVKLRD